MLQPAITIAGQTRSLVEELHAMQWAMLEEVGNSLLDITTLESFELILIETTHHGSICTSKGITGEGSGTTTLIFLRRAVVEDSAYILELGVWAVSLLQIAVALTN